MNKVQFKTDESKNDLDQIALDESELSTLTNPIVIDEEDATLRAHSKNDSINSTSEVLSIIIKILAIAVIGWVVYDIMIKKP